MKKTLAKLLLARKQHRKGGLRFTACGKDEDGRTLFTAAAENFEVFLHHLTQSIVNKDINYPQKVLYVENGVRINSKDEPVYGEKLKGLQLKAVGIALNVQKLDLQRAVAAA